MNTREDWLNAALEMIRNRMLAVTGDVVPANTKVSCGLAGGRIGAKRIGECWSDTCSADGSTEIFISPAIAEPITVLATLVHEAVHAAVGVKHGHKKPFAKVAKAMGLEGKMTATIAGTELVTLLHAWSDLLGIYPHATLSSVGRKKQSTRLVKVECGGCGYVLRTTQKWLDKSGCPLCSQCQTEDGEYMQMAACVTESDESDS